MARTWTELTIDVPERFGDAIANFLVECGAPGLQYSADGETVRLTAYFSDTPRLEILRRYCIDLGCATDGAGGVDIATREVADADWAENWKLHSQPQRVGERLYICPSWDAEAPAGRLPIVIDPGMAFGTGQHATTRGCLRQLEIAVSGRPAMRALDVGTGSGILAIALAKLGVRDVWAVDTDPTACAVATANAAANGVAARVQVISSIDGVPGTFEVVVANLYADLLEAYAPRLRAHLAAGGTVIASGLLLVDAGRIEAACERQGLTVAARDVEDSWVTLVLRTGSPP